MPIATPDLELRRQQLRRADEYVMLAESLPDGDNPMLGVLRTAAPEQPVAQQQQQIQPNQEPETKK